MRRSWQWSFVGWGAARGRRRRGQRDRRLEHRHLPTQTTQIDLQTAKNMIQSRICLISLSLLLLRRELLG